MVLDLGEVLVTPDSLLHDLANIVSFHRDAFAPAYWARRRDYDLSMTADDYWQDVQERLGIKLSQSQLEQLVEVDTTAWTTLRPNAVDLLRRLQEADVRVALLSNATPEMAIAARTADWGVLVDDWFLSTEMGVAKPDDEVYSLVARALDVPPQEIVYLEDSVPSVEAAKRAGWDTILWTSHESALAALESRQLLVTSAEERRAPGGCSAPT